MKTASAAAVLLVMLSLVAAALLVAAADDVILLPSDGGEGLDAGLDAVAVEATTSKGGSDGDGDDDDSSHEATSATAAPETGDEKTTMGDDETRPCCNITVCTKSIPPTCRCLDVVDRCAGACQKCEPSVADPSRHVCNDEYHGPTCPEPKDDDDDPSASAADGRSSPSLAAGASLLSPLVILLFVQSVY